MQSERQIIWLQGKGQIIWRDGMRQTALFRFETSQNANGRCRGYLELDLRRINPLLLFDEVRLICEDGRVVNLAITDHCRDGATFVGKLLDERCETEELLHDQ